MKEEALAHIDLFSTLDKKELKALAEGCQERTYLAGSTIIAQGDSGVGAYIITQGTVRITREVNPDRAEEDLGTVSAGHILGEMALLDDLPRSATVTAIDDVTALLIPVWEFRSFLRNNPDVAIKLLTSISRRLRRAEAAQQR
jgi:CRP-like cAMP-binding protein